MSVFYLQNKEEFGSFHSLEIIPIENILNCPLKLTNSNVVDFTYENSETIRTDILPLHESLSINAKPKKTSAGIEYKVSGGYDVAFPSKGVDSALYQLSYKKVMVKANLHNNTSIIYGSVRSPLAALYEFDDSIKVENAHKFKVKIIGTTVQKPVFL